MSSAVRPARVQTDHRHPLVRLSRLLDEGSLTETHPRDDIAVVVATGAVDGRPVVAFCTDPTNRGGSLGLAECDRITAAIERAHAEGVPVIGLWHSGGARLGDGVVAMHGIGRIFAAMVAASGVVPQISVVLGAAAGGAAYGPALTDVVIMAPEARVFITGPDVVRSVTGEQVDMADLGGPEAHSRRSGVTHLTADSEGDAFAKARRLASVLSAPGAVDPARLDPGGDPSVFLPDNPRRAYDVRPLVCGLLDDHDRPGGPLLELQPHWAPNVVTGFGSIGGGAVGVVANNPIRKGGCLDSLSAEKASRFVRTCDAFGVPLLVVVDVPGYLPGVGQEWGGVVRRGAKLLHAFAEAVVPRVTLVTRKSYGGAYIAMNSRALGATAVYAWPDAEVAVMGAEAAVGVLHRKALAAAGEEERPALLAALTEEHRQLAGGVERALDLGVVDEVIAPGATRRRIADTFAAAPRRRGGHRNIPL